MVGKENRNAREGEKKVGGGRESVPAVPRLVAQFFSRFPVVCR